MTHAGGAPSLLDFHGSNNIYVNVHVCVYVYCRLVSTSGAVLVTMPVAVAVSVVVSVRMGRLSLFRWDRRGGGGACGNPLRELGQGQLASGICFDYCSIGMQND